MAMMSMIGRILDSRRGQRQKRSLPRLLATSHRRPRIIEGAAVAVAGRDAGGARSEAAPYRPRTADGPAFFTSRQRDGAQPPQAPARTKPKPDAASLRIRRDSKRRCPKWCARCAEPDRVKPAIATEALAGSDAPGSPPKVADPVTCRRLRWWALQASTRPRPALNKPKRRWFDHANQPDVQHVRHGWGRRGQAAVDAFYALDAEHAIDAQHSEHAQDTPAPPGGLPTPDHSGQGSVARLRKRSSLAVARFRLLSTPSNAFAAACSRTNVTPRLPRGPRRRRCGHDYTHR